MTAGVVGWQFVWFCVVLEMLVSPVRFAWEEEKEG